MSQNQLGDLSKKFSVEIITLCKDLRKRKKATAIVNQLLRMNNSSGRKEFTSEQ